MISVGNTHTFKKQNKKHQQQQQPNFLRFSLFWISPHVFWWILFFFLLFFFCFFWEFKRLGDSKMKFKIQRIEMLFNLESEYPKSLTCKNKFSKEETEKEWRKRSKPKTTTNWILQMDESFFLLLCGFGKFQKRKKRYKCDR